jgi:hypothetical protein
MMISRSWVKLILTFLALVAWSGMLQARTAELPAPTNFSVAQAVEKIKAAHILKAETNFNLALKENEAVVQVARPEGEPDNDCKIEAVLIAKTLVDTYPKDITSARVLFLRTTSDSIEIPVSASQIKDYAEGKVDKHVFLDLLTVNKIEPAPSNVPKVKILQLRPDGLPTNWVILDRIQSYANQGLNMAPYRAEFDQMRKYGKAKDNEAAHALRVKLCHELHFD